MLPLPEAVQGWRFGQHCASKAEGSAEAISN
jgi:hypothetical protein